MTSMERELIKEFCVGDVLFEVNIEGIILRAHALSFGTNMKIPYEFNGGIKIHSIGNQICEGHFSTIEIDDRISHIAKNAFYLAHVEKVIWPANCKVIPYCCFASSNLKEVYNTDSVTTIEEGAFWGSKVSSFDWPSACSDIPEKCFGNSNVKVVNNVGHITSIGDYAFWDALCVEELDFSVSPISFIGEGAFEGVSSAKVKLPYYVDVK